MRHELLFNPAWSWWLYAAIGIAGTALVVHLYRLERNEVGRWKGIALTCLRLVLVALVLLMLAQPVVRTRLSFIQQRQVAVLVDDSLSMRISDGQARPAERLRWADGVGLLAHDVRPIRPEVLSAELAVLGRAAGELVSQLSQLGLYRGRQTPVPGALIDSLSRTGPMMELMAGRVEELARPLAEQGELRMLLSPAAQAQWTRLSSGLTGELLPGVRELTRCLGQTGWVKLDPRAAGDPARLAELGEQLAGHCRSAVELLDGPVSGEGGLSWAIDSAVAGRLDAESRAALDRAGLLSREELARRLLAGSGGNLLERIRRPPTGQADEQFTVNAYRFARTAARLPAERLADLDRPTGPPASQPAASESPAPAEPAGPPAEDRTDPAAAIDLLFAQADGLDSSPSTNLAGILLLTDGRFNGPGDPAGAARQRRVPIFPVRIGSTTPPTDLAIVNLQTPDSLFKEDTANIVAAVKMDGLAGRDVEVQLVELPSGGSGAPSAAKVIQSKRLRPTLPAERRTVEFALKPDRVGVAHYRVAASVAEPSGSGAGLPRAGDVMPGNDRQDFSLVVTGEPTKVLLADGQPRWEFRYLANLMLRDKGILVQYLCTSPAFIQAGPAAVGPAPPAGTAAPPAKPTRHASVKEAREKGVAEVDAFPKTVEELFAFDVIILGDLPPEDLPDTLQRDLERFVSERGGTLIVIAGKEALPSRFTDRPLAGLLPVKLLPQDPRRAAAELAPFRVRLTELGIRSDILRLLPESAENQQVWDRVPPSTWRHAALTAKPGATVLAYAEPLAKPLLAPPDGPAEPPTAVPADDPAQKDRVARERPLVLVHNYGLGQVMFLAYDRTWQLRYKTGDKHHHRLWAQVLRWATAGRLPVGTEHVKLGTDRVRYRPGERIAIRAKLSKEDFTPLTDAELAAEVIRDGRVVQRVNLLPAGQQTAATGPDTAAAGPASAPELPRGPAVDGVFVGQVGALPAGAYTVSLKVIEARGLPPEKARQPVSVECLVEGEDPVEMQELAARTPAELAEGGLVLTPSTARLADQLFGEPVLRQVRHEDLVLWSSGYFLALFALVACAEWILRKKSGLI